MAKNIFYHRFHTSKHEFGNGEPWPWGLALIFLGWFYVNSSPSVVPASAAELAEPVVLVDDQRYTAVQYLGFNLFHGSNWVGTQNFSNVDKQIILPTIIIWCILRLLLVSFFLNMEMWWNVFCFDLCEVYDVTKSTCQIWKQYWCVIVPCCMPALTGCRRRTNRPRIFRVFRKHFNQVALTVVVLRCKPCEKHPGNRCEPSSHLYHFW